MGCPGSNTILTGHALHDFCEVPVALSGGIRRIANRWPVQLERAFLSDARQERRPLKFLLERQAACAAPGVSRKFACTHSVGLNE